MLLVYLKQNTLYIKFHSTIPARPVPIIKSIKYKFCWKWFMYVYSQFIIFFLFLFYSSSLYILLLMVRLYWGDCYGCSSSLSYIVVVNTLWYYGLNFMINIVGTWRRYRSPYCIVLFGFFKLSVIRHKHGTKKKAEEYKYTLFCMFYLHQPHRFYMKINEHTRPQIMYRIFWLLTALKAVIIRGEKEKSLYSSKCNGETKLHIEYCHQENQQELFLYSLQMMKISMW